MLDLDAPIVPGRSLGGIPIRSTVAAILETATPERVIEIPGSDEGEGPVTIHSFGAIRTWSVGGIVEQVGAFEGYRGRTASGLGIGSTVAEMIAAHAEVAPMGGEGMLLLPGLPGIGIETTEWASEAQPGPAARAIQLFVHAVDA